MTLDVMPRVNGKTFRCDAPVSTRRSTPVCGANVFRYNADRTRLVCNGCGAVYCFEPADSGSEGGGTGR